MDSLYHQPIFSAQSGSDRGVNGWQDHLYLSNLHQETGYYPDGTRVTYTIISRDRLVPNPIVILSDGFVCNLVDDKFIIPLETPLVAQTFDQIRGRWLFDHPDRNRYGMNEDPYILSIQQAEELLLVNNLLMLLEAEIQQQQVKKERYVCAVLSKLVNQSLTHSSEWAGHLRTARSTIVFGMADDAETKERPGLMTKEEQRQFNTSIPDITAVETVADVHVNGDHLAGFLRHSLQSFQHQPLLPPLERNSAEASPMSPISSQRVSADSPTTVFISAIAPSKPQKQDPSDNEAPVLDPRKLNRLLFDLDLPAAISGQNSTQECVLKNHLQTSTVFPFARQVPYDKTTIHTDCMMAREEDDDGQHKSVDVQSHLDAMAADLTTTFPIRSDANTEMRTRKLGVQSPLQIQDRSFQNSQDTLWTDDLFESFLDDLDASRQPEGSHVVQVVHFFGRTEV